MESVTRDLPVALTHTRPQIAEFARANSNYSSAAWGASRGITSGRAGTRPPLLGPPPIFRPAGARRSRGASAIAMASTWLRHSTTWRTPVRRACCSSSNCRRLIALSRTDPASTISSLAHARPASDGSPSHAGARRKSRDQAQSPSPMWPISRSSFAAIAQLAAGRPRSTAKGRAQRSDAGLSKSSGVGARRVRIHGRPRSIMTT